MNVLYRQARPSDADFIRDFQIAMAFETEKLELKPEVVNQGVARVFEDPHIGTYYICEFEKQIVGSLLIIKEWSDWRNGFVWWIHSLYIDRPLRGKKLFSGFYAYIQDLVRKDSTARGLRLYVDKTNSNAQKVYRAIGMNADHYDLYEWMKSF